MGYIDKLEKVTLLEDEVTLRAFIHTVRGDAWWAKIQQETTARIALSQSANFNGKGRHMAEAPAGWQSWRPGEDPQVLHHAGGGTFSGCILTSIPG